MNRLKKANLSIECALVMPTIFLVIVFLLWLMIYLYNGCVIQKALVHGVQEADYRECDNNFELKNEVEKRIYEELKGYLVGVESPTVKVTITKNYVKASVETKLNIGSDLDILNNMSDIEVNIKKRRMHGADLINDVRRIKALYDIGKDLFDDEE